jgi:hypothetical protein
VEPGRRPLFSTREVASTRPLPWRFPGVARVHARSLATRIVLQTTVFECGEMRRETSRVSFLMCPFCVRAPSSVLATYLSNTARRDLRRDRQSRGASGVRARAGNSYFKPFRGARLELIRASANGSAGTVLASSGARRPTRRLARASTSLGGNRRPCGGRGPKVPHVTTISNAGAEFVSFPNGRKYMENRDQLLWSPVNPAA